MNLVLVLEPGMEISTASEIVIEPHKESPIAVVVVIEPGVESPFDFVVVLEPDVESPLALKVVIQLCSEVPIVVIVVIEPGVKSHITEVMVIINCEISIQKYSMIMTNSLPDVEILETEACVFFVGVKCLAAVVVVFQPGLDSNCTFFMVIKPELESPIALNYM